MLWKEVWKETAKERRWWKAHELFADRRCSQAVLNFLSSTEVGKTVPAVEEDDRSEASEWELRERAERKRKGGRKRRCWEWRRRSIHSSSPPPPSWHWRERIRGCVFFCSFLFSLSGRAGRRHKGSLHCAALRGLRPGNGLYIPLVMI